MRWDVWEMVSHRTQLVAGLLSLYASAAHALLAQPRPLRPMRMRRAFMIEQGTAEGSLPDGIAARVSFQTGGYKQAGQDEEIMILWNTFKQCYPTVQLAEEALEKNTAVRSQCETSKPAQLPACPEIEPEKNSFASRSNRSLPRS